MQKHYIIGDVHGEYQTLLALLEKLPKDARLIFVGDLVNRGSQSREVVEFVRNNAFFVVKGNHEDYFLKYGELFLEMIENQVKESSLVWLHKMLSSTLPSYGLLAKDSYKITLNKEGLEALKKDMEWMKGLPIYYDFGYLKDYPSLPVIVTHAPVDRYWFFKDNHPDYFAFFATNNRSKPFSHAPVFNIHGHIFKDEVEFGSNYINVDTGCGRGLDKKLSAYCVETKEVVSVGCVAD